MARARKAKTARRRKSEGFSEEAANEADLPKDEAGRRKIKRQYVDLLGIRVEKLRGRILNRERINKTTEGIYFICDSCCKVCHSLDDGLVEDPENQHNICGRCSPPQRIRKTSARLREKPAAPKPRKSARRRVRSKAS